MAVIFTALLLVLTISGGAFSVEVEECYGECDRSSQCSALGRIRRSRVEQCLQFLNSQCENSDDFLKCLDSYKSATISNCTKNTLKNAIPCRKCEATCNQLEEKRQADEEQCYDECSKSQNCITFVNAADEIIDDCRKLTEGSCSRETSHIACLESLSSINNVLCTRDFRKDIIMCLKCDANCTETTTAQSGVLPQEQTFQESEAVKCMATCGSTTACVAVGSAAEAGAEACQNYFSSMCKKEEAPTKCIERLNGTVNTDCPLEFRKSIADCLKCEDKCHAIHAKDEELRRYMDTCLTACSNISSCVTMDNSSDKAVADCINLFERQCENNNDTISCMESYTDEDASCSKMFRSEFIDCMKCEKGCEKGLIEGSVPPASSSEIPTAS